MVVNLFNIIVVAIIHPALLWLQLFGFIIILEKIIRTTK